MVIGRCYAKANPYVRIYEYCWPSYVLQFMAHNANEILLFIIGRIKWMDNQCKQAILYIIDQKKNNNNISQ